jgi:hypothetical protein
MPQDVKKVVTRLYNKPIPFFIASILKRTGVTIFTTWFRGAVRLATLVKPGGKTLIEESFGVQRLWGFAPEVYLAVKTIRQELNLGEKYFAVHWRSERSNCKYKECANELASGVVRETMGSRYRSESDTADTSHCLLISDIPFDTDRVLWGPFAVTEFSVPGRKEDMKTALEIMGVTKQPSGWPGCRKLDALPSLANIDVGLISIYDKVLGIQANQFHTCSLNKRKSICGVCTRTMSNFAKEMLLVRKNTNQKRSTSGAWPSSFNKTLLIATGAIIKDKKQEKVMDSLIMLSLEDLDKARGTGDVEEEDQDGDDTMDTGGDGERDEDEDEQDDKEQDDADLVDADLPKKADPTKKAEQRLWDDDEPSVGLERSEDTVNERKGAHGACTISSARLCSQNA